MLREDFAYQPTIKVRRQNSCGVGDDSASDGRKLVIRACPPGLAVFRWRLRTGQGVLCMRRDSSVQKQTPHIMEDAERCPGQSRD